MNHGLWHASDAKRPTRARRAALTADDTPGLSGRHDGIRPPHATVFPWVPDEGASSLTGLPERAECS